MTVPVTINTTRTTPTNESYYEEQVEAPAWCRYKYYEYKNHTFREPRCVGVKDYKKDIKYDKIISVITVALLLSPFVAFLLWYLIEGKNF